MNLKAKATAIVALFAVFASAIPASAGTKYDRVEAHDTDTWTLTLASCRSHTIVVDGDGDTDLDFWLLDENGNVLRSDLDGTDYCVFRIRPAWTGKFTLVIKNHGSVYNRYRVTVD